MDDYQSWKRDFALWQSITETDKKKQGVLLTLRLDKVTRDELYEDVTNEDIVSENGAKKVLSQLYCIFQKDQNLTAFRCYESFENYQRPYTVSVTECCKEFQRRLKKVEDDGTKIADHILAYKLIKSAQLNENQIQLLKATTTKMSYEEVMKQLRKIFKSDELSCEDDCSEEKIKIKVEPLDKSILYTHLEKNLKTRSKEHKTENVNNSKKRKKNPLDQYKKVTHCSNCNSINHGIKQCPDMSTQERSFFLKQLKEENVGPVFEINHVSPLSKDSCSSTNEMLSFQTRNSAMLDTGSPKNVCGKSWLIQYINNLSSREKNQVIYGKSKNMFKFGCGTLFLANQSVKIQAKIGKKDYEIHSDVIEGDIPLLFSKEALNDTNATLDCKNDTLTIMGETICLQQTVSGHYMFPLNANTQPRNNKGTLTNEKSTQSCNKLTYQVEIPTDNNERKYVMKSFSKLRNRICFECRKLGHVRKQCEKFIKRTFQTQNNSKGHNSKNTKSSCSRIFNYNQKESKYNRLNKYDFTSFRRFRKPYAVYYNRKINEFDCDIKCFACEEKGHIAKCCPNIVDGVPRGVSVPPPLWGRILVPKCRKYNKI